MADTWKLVENQMEKCIQHFTFTKRDRLEFRASNFDSLKHGQE